MKDLVVHRSGRSVGLDQREQQTQQKRGENDTYAGLVPRSPGNTVEPLALHGKSSVDDALDRVGPRLEHAVILAPRVRPVVDKLAKAVQAKRRWLPTILCNK